MVSVSVGPPLFVGGMQRSGTHALGHLVSQHSHYAMVPRELAFHVAPAGEGGIPDLLAGRIGADEFVSRMRTHWWRRTAPWDPSVTRGLHKSVPEERFQAAVERFALAHPYDGVAAVRTLLTDLLDPVAEEAGAAAWVEMDPTNILAGRELSQIFPNMRLIHTIRDGRDVACSLRRLPWGGDKLRHGIGWWESTLRDADAVVRGLPSERVFVVQLEDLVVNDRQRTYRRLLEFLELEDEPQIREFFARHVNQQNAHLGRWQTELPLIRRAALTGRYAFSLTQLRRAGVRDRPPLRALRAAPETGEYRPGAEAVDPWADRQARGA